MARAVNELSRVFSYRVRVFLTSRAKLDYLIDQILLFELDLVNKRVEFELFTNISGRVEPESSSSWSVYF